MSLPSPSRGSITLRPSSCVLCLMLSLFIWIWDLLCHLLLLCEVGFPSLFLSLYLHLVPALISLSSSGFSRAPSLELVLISSVSSLRDWWPSSCAPSSFGTRSSIILTSHRTCARSVFLRTSFTLFSFAHLYLPLDGWKFSYDIPLQDFSIILLPFGAPSLFAFFHLIYRRLTHSNLLLAQELHICAVDSP